jgi:putative membrane protein
MFDYFKAFSLLAAVLHVGFFYLETVIWGTPKANKIMKLKAADAVTMALFARNQGFYNLFLALGIFHAWFGGGDESVVVFCCACMLGASVVLVGLSNGRMLSAGLAQGMPPAIALAAHHLL